MVDDGETTFAMFPAIPRAACIHVVVYAVANGCTVRFGRGPLVKRRLEYLFGGDVLWINDRNCMSFQSQALSFITGRMPSLSLRYVCVKRAICRRLLRSFVAFGALKSPIESWNSECGQDGDGRDYDEQLDQREGSFKRGRGTFDHGFYDLERMVLCLGGERKRKMNRKSKNA